MKRLLITMMIVCLAGRLVGEFVFSPPITGSEPHLVDLTITPMNILKDGDHADWLRLKDNKGNIVPYHLEGRMEAVFSDERTVVSSRVTQVRSLDGGELEIICEITEKTPVPENVHVSFITSQRDFEQQVRVSGEQGESWKPLLDNGFIFDSSQHMNVRNLDVAFATAGCRRFRLLLSHASFEHRNALKSVFTKEFADGGTEHAESTAAVEQLFKMERIELWTVKRVESGAKVKLGKGPVFSMVNHYNPPPQERQIVEIEPDCYPFLGVGFELNDPDLNFSRKVSVFNLLDDGQETFVCDAVIRRIKVSGFFEEETNIYFPPISHGKVLLKIDNGNNPWLPLKEYTIWNPEYSLQFIAQADKMPYHLTVEVGGKKPNYDTTDILALAGGKVEPLKMRLDDSMHKKGTFNRFDYRLKKPSSRRVSRAAVVAALMLVVIAMAFALRSVLKQEN